jgi:hypothetical protein
VHGADDLLLDAKRTRAEIVVSGAGHLLAYSHASECADAILVRLARMPQL